MKKAAWLAAGLAVAGAAQGAPLTPVQQQMRAIYQELVETNTTNSIGSCTLAAQKMAKRLKAGGFKDSEIQLVIPPGGPKKGNLVARLKGDGSKKPLLLLAHIDVVEANREDWERDPFKLVEENGMFYARGASDDKAMAAAFVNNMLLYKKEKLPLKRDIILALTCDEELVPSKFDGAEYLVNHQRALIDAEIALNEGGGGLLDKEGKPVRHGIQAGEKIYQSFQLEVTNPGGHSSAPFKDNAIYHLADGLSRLGQFSFPFKLSPVTRAFYERMSKVEKGQVAEDMKAILQDPPDQAALDRLYAVSPVHNSTVRTTCVATKVDAGHADNALPQRARAIVNCRILPGEPIAEVQATLQRVVADDKIKITRVGDGVDGPMPPMPPALMKAVEEISNDMWPGVPVIPTMSTGGTDGRFLNNAGIWTYGISGMFHGPEGSGAHGLNEHIRVKSLYDGQEYLYRLGKRLATE
ncbi:Acetylornithine deacetylase/Succinyl-diaminopimelate desuccinylase [Duganella sp. CF402]|uniref:M20/M25/M40 family metallo-hydrolase n=1 Tax=unclassified Duganella TaxID=2636909 RepID=UPI0008C20A22|nr:MULTISPECIES: M20/M25/M40 family metallo-hydrolase [unclassified Duganella]RZT06255.1 acetylornithine deacetylase/succinyl-diaminopimelate desuccinylase-like protein [Duganella sp. BK701]SEM70377.1 Acetylornithine deacetylase/Succinyl-diaminopimelate desuccinylase [Duganella sp. CF402]